MTTTSHLSMVHHRYLSTYHIHSSPKTMTTTTTTTTTTDGNDILLLERRRPWQTITEVLARESLFATIVIIIVGVPLAVSSASLAYHYRRRRRGCALACLSASVGESKCAGAAAAGWSRIFATSYCQKIIMSGSQCCLYLYWRPWRHCVLLRVLNTLLLLLLLAGCGGGVDATCEREKDRMNELEYIKINAHSLLLTLLSHLSLTFSLSSNKLSYYHTIQI